MECTLTVLDTSGIQSYIFNTNELRENIGASHLVFLATTYWVQGVLDAVLGMESHNYRVKDDETKPYDSSFQIETQANEPRAEVMYAGGGNTFILFAGENHADVAKDFVFALSSKIIEQAPGLNLYAAHEPFVWGVDNLPEKIKRAMKKLSFYKNSQPVYQPLLGLGVTAACTSTQLPANGNHPDGDKNGANNTNDRPTLANRANRQVMAQWAAARDETKQSFEVDATRRLRKMFPFVEAKDGFYWTDNLDKVGSLPNKDESFIAVVHADGNGMGKKMLALTDIFKNHAKINARLYITAVRNLSMQFRETAQSALEKTIRDLFDALKEHEAKDDILFHVGKESYDLGRKYFPFRPIIFGGDDVTFVCAGGWGVRLAQRYLHHLEVGQHVSGFHTVFEPHLRQGEFDELEAAQKDEPFWADAPPYACAGVSIVKTHYPISRAYDNSEALAKSAKQMVRTHEKNKMASALDWHFTTTGLAGELTEIRAREYVSAKRMNNKGGNTAVPGSNQPYSLLMRPIMLDERYSWRNWNNFLSIYTRFETSWANKRNKMMALREVLREGPDAVEEFAQLEHSGSALPLLGKVEDEDGNTLMSLQNGWMTWEDVEWETAVSHLKTLSDDEKLDEVRCAFFDAIELQDQLFELKKKAVTA